MITNEQFVSEVIKSLNLDTKDTIPSKRYVLSTGKRVAKMFIAKAIRSRSLYREASIYTDIDCFEMEHISPIRCGISFFNNCETLVKSRNKLPELVFTRYGSSIKTVTSIDDSTQFYEVSKSKYIRNNKRQNEFEKENYFYIKDDYLYIPDYYIKAVTLQLLTLDKKKAEEVSCNITNCKSAWEYNFVAPEKFLDAILKSTAKEISNQLSIPEDENPNLDSNLKSKTIK